MHIKGGEKPPWRGWFSIIMHIKRGINLPGEQVFYTYAYKRRGNLLGEGDLNPPAREIFYTYAHKNGRKYP